MTERSVWISIADIPLLLSRNTSADVATLGALVRRYFAQGTGG